MICHDLKKSDRPNRPYKFSSNTVVSVTENRQMLTVNLYISLSHLYKNKGNLDFLLFIFDRTFSPFLPKTDG